MPDANRSTPPSPGLTPTSTGLRLEPFRGLRFNLARLRDPASVTSPPYDMIAPDQARSLARSEEHNIVRLILGFDGVADAGYERAAETLRSWIGDGTLVRDARPGLYVYEQRAADWTQRGLVGALDLDSVVFPHEDVAEPVVADRFALMRATEANLEPILLSYVSDGPPSDVVDEIADGGAPLSSVATRDGVVHSVCAVTDAARLGAVAGDLAGRTALIADGHHRYAAYQRLRATGVPGSGSGLTLLVDSARYPLRLRAIHRLLPGLPFDAAVAGAAGHGRVSPLPSSGVDAALAALAAAPADGFAVVLSDGDRFALLSDVDGAVTAAVDRDAPPAWRGLDVSVLHRGLVGVAWGMPDTPRTVTFDHDAAHALATARRDGGTAVLLRPVSENVVRELANAGVRMPRKSTSFIPKPVTGALMRLLIG